jgi:hypothetical protein
MIINFKLNLNFFNNIISDLLNKIFNNYLYYFHVNKNINIFNYIDINYIKKNYY